MVIFPIEKETEVLETPLDHGFIFANEESVDRAFDLGGWFDVGTFLNFQTVFMFVFRRGGLSNHFFLI